MKRKKRIYSIAKNAVFNRASSVVSVLLVLIVGAVILALCEQGDGKEIENIRAVNGALAIPMEKLANGTARFYRFNNGTKHIVFFVVRGSDGVFHTAFDACEVCYLHSDKGYIQKGDYMICQGCMEQYAINMIDQVNGRGCRPIHLEHHEVGENIVVTVADLNKGARFFP